MRAAINCALANRELIGHLVRQGVVGDWREPDIIRVAPVPLYNRFEDVMTFADILCETLHAQGATVAGEAGSA